MSYFSRIRWVWLCSLVVIVLVAVPLAVSADVVQNNIVSSLIAPITISVGGHSDISYYIQVEGADGQGGCNAQDGTAATLTFVITKGGNLTTDLTPSPTSLVFTKCNSGNSQSVRFTASQTGDYVIAVRVQDNCINSCGSYDIGEATDYVHVDVAITDTDGDGVSDSTDNCSTTSNADQVNTDGDAQGDACDPDDDNDTVADGSDNCSLVANTDQANTDGDAQGDACDPDDDNDTVADGRDNCSLVANTDQANNDGDAQGDACDPDDDNDTVADGSDNCSLVANTDQANNDGDAQGDACDPDDDNDTVADISDNCPLVANTDQANADGDALGNACDPNAYAPVVQTAATDANGNEGATLATSGAFSDADGNGTLTISQVSGAGAVVANADGTWSWSLATTDNGSGTVVVQATDGEHVVATDSFDWAAVNVAPTATFGNNGPVNEGSAIALSLSSPVDPSSADTAAGFTYAFDCGAGYGAFSATATASCPTTDNGTVTVKGKIQDKDGGVSEYTAAVTVNNVAPTATFGNNGPVNEGSAIALSLSSPVDPSSADTAAGFTYAFDCGAGYGAFSATAMASCPTSDNGIVTVKGKIQDKDGGVSEYTADVTINNVAPTVAAAFAASTVNCGANNATLNVSFTDPGADTHIASINWGDGSPVQAGAVTSPASFAHTYSAAGSYTAVVTITDDDGGAGQASATVAVNFTIVGGGVLQPINQDGTSVFKYKSTIPVKIKVADCNGSTPSNLTIKIALTQLSGNDPGGIINEPYSTSAADTTGYLRFTGSPDNQYIYNLATKPLPDPSATYKITLTIVQSNQIVTVNFGLKP